MAMIQCKECGKEISDQAQACPHCGCPVNVGQTAGEMNAQAQGTKKRNIGRILKTVFGLITVVSTILACMGQIGFILLILISLLAFGITGMLTDKN